MRNAFPIIFLAFALTAFTAQSCIPSIGSNKSEEKEHSSDSDDNGDHDSDPSTSAADKEDNPFAQLNKLADQLQESNTGAAEPINFREFKKSLPERLMGLDRKESSGETTGAMGFKVSTAKAIYRGDDGETLNVEITDVAGVGAAFLGMGLAAWATVEVDKETESGYERTTTFEGHKAFEKFDNNTERGEFAVIVEDRVIVSVKGRKVSMKKLKNAAEDIVDDIEDIAEKAAKSAE